MTGRALLQHNNLITVVTYDDDVAFGETAGFDVEAFGRKHGHRRFAFAHDFALDRAGTLAMRADDGDGGQCAARELRGAPLPSAGVAASRAMRATVTSKAT